jgi:acyl dehydratase
MTAYESVCWEDVNERQSLPPLSLPITLARCVMAAAGTRDIFPIHYDRDVARQANARDVFVNTMFMQALLSRFLTDWSGPRGTVRKLGMRMQDMNGPGDTITVTGTLIKKYVHEGAHLVDLDILCSNQRGRTTIAWGTMALPLRSSPPA